MRRRKVVMAIDELGFVPKAEARAQALQHSPRIGVLTPYFTAPSFVQRLRGISAALAKTNNELIIYTVDSLSRLQGYLTTLPNRKLEGLIIMSLPVDATSASRLVKHGLNTVSIESHKMGSVASRSMIAGGKLAAEYLVSKGHRWLLHWRY